MPKPQDAIEPLIATKMNVTQLALILFFFLPHVTSESKIVAVESSDFSGRDVGTFQCEKQDLADDQHLDEIIFLKMEIEKAPTRFFIDMHERTDCYDAHNQLFFCSPHEDNSNSVGNEKSNQVLMDNTIPKYLCTKTTSSGRERALEPSQECQCMKDEKGVCNSNKTVQVGEMCYETTENTYWMCSAYNQIICSTCCQDYFWDDVFSKCSNCGPDYTTPGCGVYPSCSVPKQNSPSSRPTLPAPNPTVPKFISKTTTPSTTTMQSTESSTPIQLDVPSRVSRILVRNVTAKSAYLKWTYNGKRSHKYFQIHISSNYGTNATRVLKKNTSRRNLRLPNLHADTLYTVTIYASNGKEKGPPRSEKFRTLKMAPSFPVGLVTRNLCGNKVIIEWEPPIMTPDDESVDGYQVEFWEMGNRSTVEVFKTTKCHVNLTLPVGNYTARIQAYSQGRLGSKSEIIFSNSDAAECDSGVISSSPFYTLIPLGFFIFIIFLVYPRVRRSKRPDEVNICPQESSSALNTSDGNNASG